MTKEEQLEIIEKIQMNLDSLKDKVQSTKDSKGLTETKAWYLKNISELSLRLCNEYYRVM